MKQIFYILTLSLTMISLSAQNFIVLNPCEQNDSLKVARKVEALADYTHFTKASFAMEVIIGYQTYYICKEQRVNLLNVGIILAEIITITIIKKSQQKKFIKKLIYD